MPRNVFLLLTLFSALPARAAPPCPAPEWRYFPPFPSSSAPSIQFEGTADADGNLYFIEHLSGSSDLVSISRAGLPRFRASNILPRTTSDGLGVVLGPVVSGSRVLVMTMIRYSGTDQIRSLQLTAYQLADGAIAWSTDVLRTVPTGSIMVTWKNASRPAAGNSYALVSLTDSAYGSSFSRLAAFDLASGAFVGSAPAPFGNVVVDTSGNFYVAGSGRVAAFAPSGNDLFRASASAQGAQAVGAGVIVGGGVFSLSDGDGTGPGMEVRNATTGAVLWSNPATFLSPLISQGLVWAVKCAGGAFSPTSCPHPIDLVGLDRSTGAVVWNTLVSSPDSGPFQITVVGPAVTSNGTALLALTPNSGSFQRGPALLIGIDSHGIQTSSCELPTSSEFYHQSLSLAGGQLVLATYAAHGGLPSLRGWSTGLVLAADGWPTCRGNQAASNRGR